MDKNDAAKIEGMLAGARMYLEAFADHLRRATVGKQRRDLISKLGKAMTELSDISRSIYDEHPETNPYLEVEKRTAELRRTNRLPKSGL
jgi:hypothetical protein